MNYLNEKIKDIRQLGIENHAAYLNAEPFPNISFDDFFKTEVLDAVLNEFPDLAKQQNVSHYNSGRYEKAKITTKGESLFGDATLQLAHYLNSQPFLEFLQNLTGIEEILLPDPYFEGGGFHEIKPGGMLKIHADFNKHSRTKLDRRINVLVYLNKEWEESYGGHFELWDGEMKQSYKKLLPIFNRMAIFSTTDFSYHGHPDPLTCPQDRSRKSLAFYYYTNGRPASEVTGGEHSTLFVDRKGIDDIVINPPFSWKTLVRDFIPPILLKIGKRLR